MYKKSKTIYLIRHGETDYNRQGVIQGSGINASLNEWGIAQATAFFDAYQHVPFDKIYTSQLIRTQQSVQKFIDTGIPFEKHAGLNEINWGIYEGQKPEEIDAKAYGRLLQNWKEGNITYTMLGGESAADVSLRQQDFLKMMFDRTEEETVLIATHGRAMRIMLASFFDRNLSGMDRFEHSNLCLYKLEYLYSEKTLTINLSNDITHLLTLEIPDKV